ncbi:MAG TPA: hypothetical protein VD706_00905 [Candidatus Saccharimonadales bacterium]|nr:hypothetical protein [Candidatus Saccharimonadales bacterium]
MPGLGDDIWGQGFFVRWWRLHGVRGHIHEIPWKGREAWEPKLQRLLDKIDMLAEQGHQVSLVGASAGASAVINAYVERRDRITTVAYICAKINRPETVSEKSYAINPAFKTSLYALQDALKKLTPGDKAKFHSFYSPGDNYVPYKATTIPGVNENKLVPLRHGPAIMFSISLGAQKLLRPLKEKK